MTRATRPGRRIYAPSHQDQVAEVEEVVWKFMGKPRV
jgi:hypothetical protein